MRDIDNSHCYILSFSCSQVCGTNGTKDIAKDTQCKMRFLSVGTSPQRTRVLRYLGYTILSPVHLVLC